MGGAKLADGCTALRGERLTVIVNAATTTSCSACPWRRTWTPCCTTCRAWPTRKAAGNPPAKTYACFDVLRRLGGPERIPVGDRSLALPLLRQRTLRNDRRPTEIALELLPAPGHIRPRPAMSDDPGAHPAHHRGRRGGYHEYFENLSGEPAVRGFFLRRRGRRQPLPTRYWTPCNAKDLEAIVICPANPFHSIRPILEVQGMRELLRSRGVPIIAVSPIAGASAIKGSAAKNDG